jgi:hypothetical protein
MAAKNKLSKQAKRLIKKKKSKGAKKQALPARFGKELMFDAALNHQHPLHFPEEEVDLESLGTPLKAEDHGLSVSMRQRIGDIKDALITFSRGPEFFNDWKKALMKQHGKPTRPEKEELWINFQDWFILEYRFLDGDTVVDKFLAAFESAISEAVAELVSGWKAVMEGLFEVKSRIDDGFHLKNLINEREYRVFPTVAMAGFNLKQGDFLIARIVPALGFHIFSGAVSTIQWDGSDHMRREVYRTALQMQTRNPAAAFRDNPEKLEKSLETVRKRHEDFISYFGSDTVIATGTELADKYKAFFEYIRQRSIQEHEGSVDNAHLEQIRKARNRPDLRIPDELLNENDLAMLSDPVEGLVLLKQYGAFIDIFKNPGNHLDKAESAELVMAYLEAGSISDVPFRKVAEKYPENFRRVISYCADKNDFFSRDIDGLMMEFKPETMEKLPGNVTVLDPEMIAYAV